MSIRCQNCGLEDCVYLYSYFSGMLLMHQYGCPACAHCLDSNIGPDDTLTDFGVSALSGMNSVDPVDAALRARARDN